MYLQCKESQIIIRGPVERVAVAPYEVGIIVYKPEDANRFYHIGDEMYWDAALTAVTGQWNEITEEDVFLLVM